MKRACLLVAAHLLLSSTVSIAVEPKAAAGDANRGGDVELSETLSLAESHSLSWIRNNTRPVAEKAGAWVIDPALWKEAVQQKGEGKQEDCDFHLWAPGGVEVFAGVVAITGHGAGQTLYKHPELRKIARELRLAIFMFNGNPMQRGFWPTSLLYDRLKACGQKSQHPELEHAPLFLYGHSNGTGFAAIFPATESARVWGWISMHPGVVRQIEQPRGAEVPGLIMFGEIDPYFTKPSARQNMAVVEAMRKEHDVLWHCAVEPGTGHGPGANSWTLVFSFLRHSFAARVPADCDPRKGPVTLVRLPREQGYLGKNWDTTKGGYQTLSVAPAATFADDKSTASWLLNGDYAADWRQFQSEGKVTPAGQAAKK